MNHFRLALTVFILSMGLTGLSRAQDESLKYYQAGDSLYSKKDYDQAIRYYDAALQANPNLWQAFQGMGNCYYAKGEKSKALSNYQRSLSLHPDNPSLSSFAQSLRAEIDAAQSIRPEDKYSVEQADKILRIADRVKDEERFELRPALGVALESGGPMGLGGGMGGYYMFDSHFGIGGMFHLYVFSESLSSPFLYENESFVDVYGTKKSNATLFSLEVVPAIKYVLDGKVVRPYLVAGAGVALLMASISTTHTYDNGPPNGGPPYLDTSQTGSQGYPILEAGGGLEFTLDPTLKFFMEARLESVIAGFYSASYFPVEGGLSFKM